MSEKPTGNSAPAVKRADALQPGDHVMYEDNPWDSRRPWRVLFTHPYQDGDGTPRVALVLDAPGNPRPMGPVVIRPTAGEAIEMADEQDLAAARDAARRQQLFDDLLAVRHVLDAAGVRPSAYQGQPLYLHVVEGEIDRLADVLGLGVEPFGESGDAVAIDWTAPGGTDLGDRLTVRIWGRRAPVPQPEPGLEPDGAEVEQEWLFTFGPDHSHPDRFVRIFGSYGGARERMCRVFGNRWSAQYDWRAFDRSGLQAMLTELPESEWPTSAIDLSRTGVDRILTALANAGIEVHYNETDGDTALDVWLTDLDNATDGKAVVLSWRDVEGWQLREWESYGADTNPDRKWPIGAGSPAEVARDVATILEQAGE